MNSDTNEYFTELEGKSILISFGEKLISEPKAVIIFTFGIPRNSENNKSYQTFKGAARYLSESYACACFSPAGMGKSTGDTTELSLRSRAEELLAVVRFCQAMYPNVPLFLYGASMGAHLTLSVVEKVNPAGIILASPAAYAERAEDSLFNGTDFAQAARLTKEDQPINFSVTKTLRRYAGPAMLIWLEKDRLSTGGPIWDEIYEAINETMENRKNVLDKIFEIGGLEHGYRLNGVDPGPENPAGVEGLKKSASEINLFIEGVLK